eukprot:TRINITY_DN56352_c0_g1_i3.p1 TRINITY_DN56352_c0_g1~~TRINITY_DN56352_c0_g1_i3.p1  ORF type:complete len:220 (-),score=39.11 TRINITY_DN56352_c0_g1_i3:174-833(-)
MMADFMFDNMLEPSERLPWNLGPILHANAGGYERGLIATRITLCCTLLFLSLFYLRYATDWCGPAQEDTKKSIRADDLGRRSIVLPEKVGAESAGLSHIFFVTAWILKDVCWTFDILSGALVFALVLCSFMAQQVLSAGIVSPALQAAECLWVAGNTIWVISELWDDDLHTQPRCTACAFLLSGVVMAVVHLWGSRFTPRSVQAATAQHDEERRPLLGN